MKSHGTGLPPWNFSFKGNDVVIEETALVFHPENIRIGDDVYIGHQTILKGYYQNALIIGDGSWIGQQCFFHSAGGINIGCNVGIGPGVKILTTTHRFDNPNLPIIHQEVIPAPVKIGDNCDIGCNALILPGVELGKGCQIGAGAVVTKSFSPFSLLAGVPAKLIRTLTQQPTTDSF